MGIDPELMLLDRMKTEAVYSVVQFRTYIGIIVRLTTNSSLASIALKKMRRRADSVLQYLSTASAIPLLIKETGTHIYQKSMYVNFMLYLMYSVSHLYEEKPLLKEKKVTVIQDVNTIAVLENPMVFESKQSMTTRTMYHGEPPIGLL